MDEEKTQAVKEVKQEGQETPQQPPKPLSIVDEAKLLRDEIRRERETIEAERRRMEQINAENILGGHGGSRVPDKPKEVTPSDYVDKLERGEVNPLRDDGII